MWLYIIEVLLGTVLFIILFFKYSFGYWKRRGIPYAEPQIPFGNFKEYILLKISLREQLTPLYNKFKLCGKPYVGIFLGGKPILLCLSPSFLKKFMVEDFNHFDSRSFYYHEKNDPLSAHLFNLDGEKWRFMRHKLTPTFTSGKLKMMFHFFVECSQEIGNILDKHVENGEPLEVKEMMARFTTDIIGSCAFGIECNSLKEPNNIFRKNLKMVFDRSVLCIITGLLSITYPSIVTLLKLRTITTEPADFLMDLVKQTVDYREKNKIVRNDFLNLLIQLKKQGHLDGEKDDLNTKKLTIEQIAAQCFVFFVAGFETSSNTMSLIIYELAKHPEIQVKVRNEMRQVLKKHNGVLTYDCITEMTYLKQVIDENLRVHPVSLVITRSCTKDYKLPESDVILKKGTSVFIPVIDFHKDERYFKDPEVYDPDRFSPERKSEIIPYTYMPFGYGPKNCIGMRFGLLELMVGLVALLKNYNYTLNTKSQGPLKINPRNFLYEVLGGIWVNVEKVKDEI